MVDPALFARAVWDGDEVTVAAMIAAGAQVDPPRGPYGAAALDDRERSAGNWSAVDRGRSGMSNRPMSDGLTPLEHAIDEESQAACLYGLHPDNMPLELTVLLLASGAVPTEAAFRVANCSYGHQRILSLLESYGSRAKLDAASDRDPSVARRGTAAPGGGGC